MWNKLPPYKIKPMTSDFKTNELSETAWNKLKDVSPLVMRRILMNRYRQTTDIQDLLLATKKAPLWEANPKDTRWVSVYPQSRLKMEF